MISIMMERFKRSSELFDNAKQYIPGGVNSPVRSFYAVGGHPPFINCGHGSKIYDVDGNEYIDYVCSWGALILGHASPRVVSALKKVVEDGTSYGAPTRLETTLAELICTALPSVDMVRFVNSGTEATMSAIRLARAYTGRDKIVKFSGNYHGHYDGLLASAGSGVATLGIPSSPGVPSSFTADTVVIPYNDLDIAEQIFRESGSEIAAVIIEPVAANMGVVVPEQGYLSGLRRLTSEFESLLIFDEVITGFRVEYGGAQTLYGIMPDLTCLGKIIGGGLPVGAYGGRRELMEMVAPLGPVYQAGTLSGNPVAMTAGIETLKLLRDSTIYKKLDSRASRLEETIVLAASQTGIRLELSRIGSMFTIFFSPVPVKNYETARSTDTDLYKKFFHRMLINGIYLPPSPFEANFLSSAHNDNDIETTGSVIHEVFNNLGKE